MWKSLCILTFLGLSFGSLAVRAESRPVGEQPMFGGVELTAAMKKANDDFLAAIEKTGLTRERASSQTAALGWQYFSKGDLSTAIKRFNQTWLLNPDNGNAYHGFAVVTAQRAGPLSDVEKYFRIAVSKPGVSPTAHVDFARLLNMTGHFDDAIAQAEKALAISPTARNAFSQISYAHYGKKDVAGACEWARRARENGNELDPPSYFETVCRDPQ